MPRENMMLIIPQAQQCGGLIAPTPILDGELPWNLEGVSLRVHSSMVCKQD